MAAETVITVPLLLLLLLLIVQFALAEHAQHIAQAAASRALADARAQGGSAGAGRSRAQHTLAALGSAVLLNPKVTVTRGAGSAAVQVSGDVQQVIPGLHLRVTGRAGGAVERWSTVADGR
ncbi:TadE/TadG family type IV pilus assembly protein [Actinacidiphila oryziradicis]|uniref:TadE/TadG family type IV pilus assembly protein n=1 Tax=Actinacidiphila oryziradicis TaxID=2571141 RepID=UPI001FE44184|nr:TadE/TadG family type IV pilus assembly protein [Actinacidiphila oryziradicis]